MKFLVTAIAVFFCTVGAFAQNAADVKLNKTKHNFGKIKQNVPASYTFVITNNGDKPLIIENATAECGCTSPEWSQQPIMKGKTGTVKATFNAAAVGPFTKKVTIKFAKINEPVQVTIEGEVLAAAPAKKS
ncbi:MAG TPA: DUF1573 domain-containing protein [Chitinophagaceae bacterium]|jgi:hypothetical protein|nr:DUF1573 domain-containing protein [Chitinophagaceae bacterium]HAN39002.1 DUF1573 domain-containing protein [Chitinophagaceae bacterium]